MRVFISLLLYLVFAKAHLPSHPPVLFSPFISVFSLFPPSLCAAAISSPRPPLCILCLACALFDYPEHLPAVLRAVYHPPAYCIFAYNFFTLHHLSTMSNNQLFNQSTHSLTCTCTTLSLVPSTDSHPLVLVLVACFLAQRTRFHSPVHSSRSTSSCTSLPSLMCWYQMKLDLPTTQCHKWCLAFSCTETIDGTNGKR